MSRGKITHVIDSLGPGGAERLLVAYAPRIAKLGFDVNVVVLQEKQGNFMIPQLVEAGIPVTWLPIDKLRRVDQIASFLRAMRQSAPDLIHAHLEFASILGSVSGRLTGTPVVATLHTLDVPALGNRRDVRRWLMYRSLSIFAARVICLTQVNADIARSTGLGSAPIMILPNGVEIEDFDAPPRTDRAAVRRQFGIPESAPLAVSVCVLRPEKALDRLLMAFPEVARALPDAQLLIVGDGPMMDPLRALAEQNGLTGQVHFAGYRNDVADMMRAADVFVLPTIFDAQPTVIMEAMAARLPVVATTTTGIPDMVKDGANGTLVPPDDVPALARALTDMLADPAKGRQMGEAGRQRVVAEFSIDQQIARLGALYDALIAERRARR
jgi:glycosyltransferase involved in cell wall biosynthesis